MTAATCGDVLARLMRPDVPAALQLRACDLFFRLTCGYAPTRTARFTAKLSAPRFFEERAATGADEKPRSC